MPQRTKPKPKPEIENFRIRWDKVADLAAITGLWAFTVWGMVLVTIAVFHNL